MTKLLTSLFPGLAPQDLLFKTINGEGFDDYKAYNHAKREFETWQEQIQREGQAINVIGTSTYYDSYTENISNCTIVVEYKLKNIA